MKIHSKFRDYYDTALGFGVDTTLHYDRRERVFYYSELKNKFNAGGGIIEHYIHRPSFHMGYRLLAFEFSLVGFCGKIYPCLLRYSMSATHERGRIIEYVYSRDRLSEILATYKEGTIQEGTRKALRRFLSEPTIADGVFVEIDAPVFFAKDDDGDVRLITNHSLKEVEFYKVADAFTAFQEIAMYLGNQLVKRDEVLEISDKHKITQHGYDERSFRKAKARRC